MCFSYGVGIAMLIFCVMDFINIKGVILTPLKRISNPLGDILHGLKENQIIVISSIPIDEEKILVLVFG